MIPGSHQHCPVGHTTALLGDRWSLLIVREALRGVDRYDGFRRALGISDHTLSRRLTHLVQIGLLRRTESPSAGYALTEAGADLARVLAVIGDWGMRWLPVEPPFREIPEPVLAAAAELGLSPPELPTQT
jgi:DNA-binding HxlR family transcriptional regulator